MSTTAWHADAETLRAYAEGRTDAILGASIEQHLSRCSSCRSDVTPLADPRLVADAWAAIRADLESPRLPRPLRWARRLGLEEPTAILLSAAASLRTAWFSAGVVTLAFAMVATHLSFGYRLWPFLLLAPLIPVLGVAVAYGDSEDPFEALAVTAPYGRTRLVLVRTAGVVTSTLPIAALLGLLLPGPDWVAVAWLGPALAMVPLQLALASFVGPNAAGAVLAIAWCGVVGASLRLFTDTWPVEATQQLVYLVLALLAGIVLLVRSRWTHTIGAVL